MPIAIVSTGTVVSFLLVATGGYGALLLILYLVQPSLLYFPNMPSREIVATPEQIGLDYQGVSLRTGDGITLDAWFVPLDRPRATLLFFHGNAGNMSHRLDSLRLFHDLGLSILIFDYRGYGRSGGEPSEAGTYRDAEAAWRYLTEERGISPQRIVLFGRSLGGAIAAHLASRRPAAALILESTFTSVPDLGAELYPFLPVRWLSRFRYETSAYVAVASCPVLIVHSRDDEIVPFRHAQSLLKAAHQPKRLLQIAGGHNDGFLVSGRSYREGLDTFLTEAFGPSPTPRAAP